MIESLYSDFEQHHSDDINNIQSFLQDRNRSAGKHWRVKGPFQSGKSLIAKKAINHTTCLDNGKVSIFNEPVRSKKDFFERIRQYCDHKIDLLSTSDSVPQLVAWYSYKTAVDNLLGNMDKNADDENKLFDCLLEIHHENKLAWWIGACTDDDLRELNGVYDQLVQVMHGRSAERDRLPTILLEQWITELTEWDDCNIREVPRNSQPSNISQTAKIKSLTQTPKSSSMRGNKSQNITELAISSEHDTLLTDTVIQEVFELDKDLTDRMKSSLRTIVNEYAGRHFGANEMIFEALVYARARKAARAYIQDILGNLEDNDTSSAISNIESLLKFYETERQLDLAKWSKNLGKSIAIHVDSEPYLYGFGLCIKRADDSYQYIGWLKNLYFHQGEERMDPFISYMAVVAPVLTPLVMEAGIPVARYFGESTVELLKRLFNRDEDPVEVARRHQQTLDDFIEAKLELSQTDSDRAYAESMRGMQIFVQRPDVFTTDQLLRDFYFDLNVARPFGPYDSYDEEKKATRRDTAAHFVYLAWSEKKLHVVAKWLKENRLAAFQTINND